MKVLILSLLAAALCTLSSTSAAAAAQGDAPPSSACQGNVCTASLAPVAIPSFITIQATTLKHGKSRTITDCTPCKDCVAGVLVTNNTASCTVTVWDFGTVPSDEEQDIYGPIESVDVPPGQGTTQRLENYCNGLRSPFNGTDVISFSYTCGGVTRDGGDVGLSCDCNH